MTSREFTFEHYLIDVGYHLHDTIWERELIRQYVDYFKECYDKELSAYKALLFFPDYVDDLKLGKLNSLKDKL